VATPPPPIDEVDQARSQEYALLSLLLTRSPDARMLERLAELRGDATPIGMAHAELAKAAARTSVERSEREYFDLFVGLGEGGLFPYSSYYLTGVLQGQPLARLRETLRILGLERSPELSEPEDHAAFLLAAMASIISGRIAAAAGAERAFFERYLAPWLGRFFLDLRRAPAADLYARVGGLGLSFMEIEAQAFTLGDTGTRCETT
jgi:TorA maturation chaperone TorD